LEQSILVLSEQGISSFSLKDVATRAKVSGALIYYYFHSKERLAEETLDRYMLPIVQGYWEIMDKEEDPVRMIASLQKSMLESARDSPWFISLWTRELASDSQPLRSYLMRKADRPALTRFAAKIRAAQERNALNPGLVPEMLYITLFSTVYVTLLARKNWEAVYGTEIPIERLEEHLRSFVMKGVLGDRLDDGCPEKAKGQGRKRALARNGARS
jgi:AcrR family transcriptional regulator